jgi:hypothetical protein
MACDTADGPEGAADEAAGANGSSEGGGAGAGPGADAPLLAQGLAGCAGHSMTTVGDKLLLLGGHVKNKKVGWGMDAGGGAVTRRRVAGVCALAGVQHGS